MENRVDPQQRDKILSTAALVAITTDRNAAVSRKNEIATTAMISHASR